MIQGPQLLKGVLGYWQACRSLGMDPLHNQQREKQEWKPQDCLLLKAQAVQVMTVNSLLP